MQLDPFHITYTATGNYLPTLDDGDAYVQNLVCMIVSSATEYSTGYSDSSNNFTWSNAYSERNQTYTITHYRNKSGVKTKVFEAKVPVNGFNTAGQFNFNVTTCTENTVVRFIPQVQ